MLKWYNNVIINVLLGAKIHERALIVTKKLFSIFHLMITYVMCTFVFAILCNDFLPYFFSDDSLTTEGDEDFQVPQLVLPTTDFKNPKHCESLANV
jgi:hypothetical protein